VTAVILNRLAQRDIEAIIDGVVGNKLISADMRQDIIERTDGVPLFVEEMTKAVLEAGSEGAAQGMVVASIPSSTVAVPASLQASLLARLDRLGSAREVAQVGAAIGREVSHSLLSAVVRKPEQELASALDRLVHAGLLFRQGVPPHATYLFKHALVQDAAYGTLLREPRRALHTRIAETLETSFPEIADSQPELIARHCTEAGLTEKAARLWGKAGQRSLERSALLEAAEQLTRALEQIAVLPPTPALRREEVKLKVALITPLMHIKGYAAAETKTAIERARSLIERVESVGERLEDPLLLFSVLLGVWVASFVAFNGSMVRELAEQYLELAYQQPTIPPRLVAHRLMGSSRLLTGDIKEAVEHYSRVIALYDPAENRQHATRFSIDARGAALTFRAMALWLLGYPDTALADAEHALKDAREIRHAASLMHTLANTLPTLIRCGCYGAASELLNELALLANDKGALLWKAQAETTKGRILALTGEASDAVQVITSGLTASRATGSTILEPENLCYLAEAYAKSGRLDEAERCIHDSLTLTEQSKERWSEAEINRVAGEIALMLPEPNAVEAEAYFERALSVARQQQTRSWELRAAMSMARLWRDQGKREEARELLAPVYDWFTEGFDTLDLKDAKALLEELSS
jgi:predicted ATPase